MVRAYNFDISLDDVIKTQRQNRRNNGGGPSRFNSYAAKRRSNNNNYYRPYSERKDYYRNDRSRYSYNYINRARKTYQNTVANGIKLQTNPNITKMNVSNLDFGVTQGDMRELFGSVGKLKHVALHYDKSGRSQGTCEIIFERKQDAMTAYWGVFGVKFSFFFAKKNFQNMTTGNEIKMLKKYENSIWYSTNQKM